jgi:hypothetical protein
MYPRHVPPAAFLLTGFAWLVIAALLGLAILIGLVRGTPLPSWMRLVHVHAALVGGVAQMILGGFLAFIPPLQGTSQKPAASYPLVFVMINGGIIGMLAGFGMHQSVIAGLAGVLILTGFLWLAGRAWAQARRTLGAPHLNMWYYAAALVSLLAGLAAGEALALGFGQAIYGHVRLAHIHLTVTGFVTLVIIGMLQHLLPAMLHAPLASPRLARPVLVLMLLGVVVLIGGFLSSSVWIELGAGALLLIGTSVYTGNLFKTWMASSHKGSAASDHVLLGIFFLLLTVIMGILVAANSQSTPPLMPYGTLHLVAYTHMALVGFVVNTIMGALSHLLPVALAVNRVPSNKKRGPYLDRLIAIMDRWRTLQIAGLSLGTMGLVLLASLTWNVPLSSLPIQVTLWACFALLLGGLVVFSVKVGRAVTARPLD